MCTWASRRWRQTHPRASKTGHVNSKKSITYFRISLIQRDPKVSNTFFRIYRAGFRSSSVGLAWLAGLRRSLARLRRGFDAASTRLRRGLDAASTRPRRNQGASMGPQWGFNAFCVLLVHFSSPSKPVEARPQWSLHAASTHSAYYLYTFQTHRDPWRPSPTWRFIILKGSRRASTASRLAKHPSS